jgi:hypothetical protein
MRSTASARRRQVLVDHRLDGLGVRCEVVVRKEVPHAGDVPPLDPRLGVGDGDAERLYGFTDLEEPHCRGVHDDLDCDRPVLEV